MDESQPGDEIAVTDYPFLAEEDPARAAEHFRLAVARLGKIDGATPIPLNYALFYFYVAGTNSRFNAMLDRMIGGAGWDHETASKLFMRFFTPCSDASMADLQQELLTVLNDIVGSVIDVAGNADQRTERLGQKVARLGECTDPKQSLAIASDILVEAHELVADSKALATELRHSASEVERLKEDLLHARREAYIDTLTGLTNRRAFDKDIKTLIDEAERDGTSFCLVLVDVDHFKKINDEHGHLIGDRVLTQLGKQLSSRTRSCDKVSRYGGEEFAILLPNTEIDQAAQVAEHIREGIGRLNMRRTDNNVRLGTITASFGVAEYQQGDTPSGIIARADDALYKAKLEGRNRVCRAGG